MARTRHLGDSSATKAPAAPLATRTVRRRSEISIQLEGKAVTLAGCSAIGLGRPEIPLRRPEMTSGQVVSAMAAGKASAQPDLGLPVRILRESGCYFGMHVYLLGST